MSSRSSSAKRKRMAPRSYARKRQKTSDQWLTRGVQHQLRRTVFPRTWKRTFNYVERITMDGGVAGAANTYYFSCNGMYDPNRTGTGHQPMGFDQLFSEAYDHFVVIGSKIQATFVNVASAETSAPQIVGVGIRDTASGGGSNVETILERGNVDWTTVGPISGNNSATVTKGVNPAKWLGRSKPLADSALKGSYALDPTEECFFELFVANTGDQDPPTIDVIVQIEYEAVCIEPKALTAS